MAKQRGQLSASGGNDGGAVGGGGGGGGGGPLGEPGSPPTPAKRTPDSAKKCDPQLKPDLTSFAPLGQAKLKIEPGESPGGGGCGMDLVEAELTARRLGVVGDGDPLSPRNIPPPPHYIEKYGIGKEEAQSHLLPHHPTMAMSLEPTLHHLTDPTGNNCNNFSVDSIMTTSRDGSPGAGDTRVSSIPEMGGYNRSWGNSSPTHYPTCLYPGQTSLEELSSMTAACLSNQNQMGLYPRPSWYTMPGHHSPNSVVPTDQSFPQARDYFEPVGKAPSPIQSCEQGPYRSPPYRTSYYAQECDKY